MSKDVSVRTDEQTWWQWLAGIDIFEAAKQFWSKLLDVLRYYVTQLADELVEIVSRGIMLVTPFPNAVSLYKTTQVQLGFTWYEAAAFAMTIEFIIFFLIEVALKMLSRWLDDWGKVYQYAFWGMVIVVVCATAGVVAVVYNLEPHKILAAMPGFSLAGFIAIGLKRWDRGNEEKRLQRGVKRFKVNHPKPDSLGESEVNHSVSAVNHPDTDAESLLNHFAIHPMHSQREAAEATGLNQPKVNRILKRLESEGVIHRNGSGVEILNR